jgi:MFS family permease
MSRFALTPILVRDVLGAGPAGLGMLTAAGGLGSFFGSMAVDATGRRFRRGPTLLGAFAIAGCTLALLGSAPSLVFALVFACGITTTMIVYQVTSMTFLQVLAPGRMRGRVLALFDLVRLGLVPIGSLIAGALAPLIGVSAVFLMFGGATVGAAALVAIVCRPLLVLDLDTVQTTTPEAAPGAASTADPALTADPTLGSDPARSG